MSWAKLDDGFYAHPKVLALEKDLPALALWVLGLSYCAQQKTDGLLSRPAAIRLVGQDHVDNWAQALVRVRLWKKVRAGWRYHDYLDYQDDRKTITKRVADNRARQQRFRASHQRPNALDNALVTRHVTRGVTGILSTPLHSTPLLSHPIKVLGSSTRSDGALPISEVAHATRKGARNGHLSPEVVAKLHAAHPEKTPAQILALFGEA
jgi:hypothetical protein